MLSDFLYSKVLFIWTSEPHSFIYRGGKKLALRFPASPNERPPSPPPQPPYLLSVPYSDSFAHQQSFWFANRCFWKKNQLMFSTLPTLNIIKNGVVLIPGSFSISNGDGNENVTFTMNSRFFKFCGVYSNSLKMSHVGEFPRSWVLRDHTHLSSLVYLLRVVSRRSRATTAKKCTKKRDARAKLLFCLINNSDCFGFMVL